MLTLREQTRYAVRALRRTPGFTAMTIGLLCLGIAATAAVYSAAIAVLVRDLPVRDQGRLVALWATGAGVTTEVPTSLARYERFRKTTTTLSSVGGYAHYGWTSFWRDR